MKTKYSASQIAKAVDAEATLWAEFFGIDPSETERVEQRKSVMRANVAVGYIEPLMPFLSADSTGTEINQVHLAIAEYDEFSVIIAIFWEHEAAVNFAESQNDEIQADLVAIESVPLIDMYGFPCKICDLATIAPWISDTVNIP